VNIHGHKTLDADPDELGAADGPRRVNGMGTGVVVDPRGYIMTNHHVIDGVARIHVTLADGTTQIAKLFQHDVQTDLAIIKIDVSEPMTAITIGTSSDLMPGEPVIAVGNAYGYEHTVTRGIVSALHRTVQINDAQTYEDLIQTDASINPGNSGGPLLNADGEMIGINVAVRSGAQGIGFAIPADMAMDVAAELFSIQRARSTWHGVIARTLTDSPSRLVVERVEDESPAASGGLRPGDLITSISEQKVARNLDLERALLGRKPGDEIELTVRRNAQPLTLKVVLAARPKAGISVEERAWETLGLRLRAIPARQLRARQNRFRSGLMVTGVRPESPAEEQGIREGDILVGMHIWETASLDNVAYILNRDDLDTIQPLKFVILRGERPYEGFLPVSARLRR
jgi:serine protease Do